ncbi:O-antigen ligase family protein [Kerstersia gyiorum]|uniref:O-antigen ligase family protein n=1 Tax=Kerstersia gyiorum TaxID=206506 RepID=UPI001071411A|nr:O-antigen ligase family protein [Kerstersia gyiorum]QBR42067.1 O-antigen ligase family protein [Kerstersia gyiorum]
MMPNRAFYTVLFSSIVVFLTGAISLVVPSGYSVSLLLSLAGLGALCVPGFLPKLERRDKWLIAVFLFYFAVWVFEIWRDGQPSSSLDKPVRILLAIPALFWLLRYPPSGKAFWGGVAVGAIVVGLWAGWQKLVLGLERAEGFTSTIQFGNISMLLGMLSLTGLAGWSQLQHRRWWWGVLLALGVAFGFMGSIFSGSRGGWIGVPFILLVLVRAYGKGLRPSQLWGLLAGVVALGSCLYFIPATGVKDRVNSAFEDVYLYVQDNNPDSSLGGRFEMWKAGVYAIQEQPLLGRGSKGYIEYRDQLIAQGKVDPIISEFTHLHNEYIDITVKRGVLGLISLLLLYLVPLRMFMRMLGEGVVQRQPYAAAGAVLCVSYMDFGLSQTFLSHNSGVMVLFFMMVIIWSLVRAAEHAPAGQK